MGTQTETDAIFSILILHLLDAKLNVEKKKEMSNVSVGIRSNLF